MKLFKYLFFILILMGSLIFLVQLNELNQIENQPLTIKIPYLIDLENFKEGFNVWLVLVLTLTVGVLIGFVIALFQIISYKAEALSLKSKLKRIQVELNNLRNQNIDDDIILEDSIENSDL